MNSRNKKIIMITCISVAIATAVIVPMMIFAGNNQERIETIEGVVEMPYTTVGCKVISAFAKTFINYTFESMKPHIKLYLQLKNPGGSRSELADGTSHVASGSIDVSANPGNYAIEIWNLDPDQERVNISYRIVYDRYIDPDYYS